MNLEHHLLSRVAAKDLCSQRSILVIVVSGPITRPVPEQTGQGSLWSCNKLGRTRCRVISSRPNSLKTRTNGYLRTISSHFVNKAINDLFSVSLLVHIDEIDNYNTANIPQRS